MTGGLSKRLRQLDAFLMSETAPEDSMMLSELDGFLAGVIVCPDLIMPSEWMPLIWGEDGPGFESMEQLETVNGAIMGHYNDIIHQLNKKRYAPVFDVESLGEDADSDETLWELWLEGFYAALTLRPDAWIDLEHDGAALKALSIFMRLHEITTTSSLELAPMDGDEELETLAPDMIPLLVQNLHDARLALAGKTPKPANQNHKKTGRNDPCPCGSGKKFKKCCLN